MRDHLVIVNAPETGAEDYFRGLMRQLQESRGAEQGLIPTLILSRAFPHSLPADLEEQFGVVQYAGTIFDPSAPDATSIDRAAIIVILAEREGEWRSDSHTFDIIHRLRDRGIKARIIAECVDDRNRARFRSVGADVVVRPMRGYPEMIARAIVAPGSEAIIEELFTSAGDECLLFELDTGGWPWGRIVSRLVEADVGLAVAYRDAAGAVCMNPPPGQAVAGTGLYVIVRSGRSPTAEDVRRVIAEA